MSTKPQPINVDQRKTTESPSVTTTQVSSVPDPVRVVNGARISHEAVVALRRQLGLGDRK